MSDQALKKTPLNGLHRALGARMVPFGGWDMPVQYSGVIEEHRAVRGACGLFDVSHMGEVSVRGPEALAFLQRLTSNDVARLEPGQAHYSGLTTPEGTFVDDILVYRLEAEGEFMVVINASNIDKDVAWMKSHAGAGVTVEDRSPTMALLALQGPHAVDLLARLADCDAPSIGYYRFRHGKVAGFEALVSRTGYTGEDGFELYIDAGDAEPLFRKLLEEGEKEGIKPCGLGARDTLRLEAKLPLYGNDIDATTTVLEADLGFIVKLKKGEFLGSEVLTRQKQQGVTRKLVGFEMVDSGIGRHGYPVYVGGHEVGQVTSGSPAPSLGKNIGCVYLPIAATQPGTSFEVGIRGKRLAARVVPTPFYAHRTLARK